MGDKSEGDEGCGCLTVLIAFGLIILLFYGCNKWDQESARTKMLQRCLSDTPAPTWCNEVVK